MISIGIDPGQTGGIVAIDEARRVLLSVAADDKDRGYVVNSEAMAGVLLGLVRYLPPEGSVVVIEMPTVQPPTGRTSCLTIGKNWGIVVGALSGAGYSFRRVSPSKWSGDMLGSPPKGGWKGADKKQAAMALCMRELPMLDMVVPGRKKRHDGLADAGCLAIFGLRGG